MKTLRNILIILVVTLNPGFLQNKVSAQEQNWEWASPVYSTASNAGYSIVADEAGNSFVAGSFSDTLHIGGRKLVSKGYYDIFIAAFATNGELKWLKQAGGPEADEAYGIAVDNSGNVNVTGYFSGTVDFSGKTIKSYGNRDFFVAKYDKNGAILWVKSGKVSSEDYANAVCTDNAGNVFISGFFHGTMYLENSEYKSKNNRDLFIMKFNTGGDLQWVRVGGGNGKDEITAIHADGEGNLYFTGTFEKEMIFDKILLESNANKDIFLAKYNPDGTIQWLRKGGSASGHAYSTAIEIDAVGNIYTTGYFSGIAFFNDKRLKTAGSDDIFLAKYNGKGDILWIKQAGGQGNERAKALTMDGSGNIYLAGEFDFSFSFASKNVEKSGDWDVFVLRYHDDGEMAGNSQISGPGFKKATSLAIDKAGNAYLLGYFIQQASFGNITLKAVGPQGCGFIAKMKHFAKK